MKLNMGCGHNKLTDYINVDLSPNCEPDRVVDLETIPWPWPDDSVDEVLFNHCLEHLGQETNVFLAIIKELYRVCRHDAIIRINVPHPRHDHFIGDPTHVRIITPDVLNLFSKRLNDEWKRSNFANTPLAHYLDVDFEVESAVFELDEPYFTLARQGVMNEQEIQTALREKNNVAHSYRFLWRVKKDTRATEVNPVPTAFLLEPDWSGLAWVEVVYGYLEAFTQGESVALVIPLDGSIPLAEVEKRILEVAVGSGRETFPEIILLGAGENLLETLRRFVSIQWIPNTGSWTVNLTGPFGSRLVQARKRLISQ